MTPERQTEIEDAGWKAYFDDKSLEDCPNYSEQDEREEWQIAWLSALNWENSDPYQHL